MECSCLLWVLNIKRSEPVLVNMILIMECVVSNESIQEIIDKLDEDWSLILLIKELINMGVWSL